MKIKTGLSTLILTGMGLSFINCAISNPVSTQEKRVPYKRLPLHEYHEFGKWGQSGNSRFGLAQTLEQYGGLYYPVYLIFDNSPVKPSASLFEDQQILAVGRITYFNQSLLSHFYRALFGESFESYFQVEDLIENNEELKLYYIYTGSSSEPNRKDTGAIKNELKLQIPKKNYRRILFFENGQEVARLKIAEGEWSTEKHVPDKAPMK
ncbi:MAG: hypothetical protein WCO60_17110 [Verrucomicrobiota bacterium]